MQTCLWKIRVDGNYSRLRVASQMIPRKVQSLRAIHQQLTCLAYRKCDDIPLAARALSATISTVDERISQPEYEELLRWHQRLGHLAFEDPN
jgi:hypothetical protein